MRDSTALKLILGGQKAILDEMRGILQDIITVNSATWHFGRFSVTEGEVNALHEAVNEATERSYLLAARLDMLERSIKPEKQAERMRFGSALPSGRDRPAQCLHAIRA